ncbi:hypothetical protein ACFY1B_02050 [Streptomyces mirabilis]|nr:hypothetical protein [Streptomyces sp. AK02-04a]MDX3755040.1 hypothetical protein [Streptomyces sp. AK02-04a]
MLHRVRQRLLHHPVRGRIAPDGFAALGALPAVGWAARTRSAVALRTE